MQKPHINYFPPCEPSKPIPPKKIVDLTKEIKFGENSIGDFDLHKVLLKIKELDIDIPEQDVQLNFECYNDYYDSTYSLTIKYKEIQVANPSYELEVLFYERQIKDYEKNMIKYQKELEKYNKEKEKFDKSMKIWEEENKKTEIKKLEKKIAQMKKDEKKLAELKKKL